MHDGLLTGAGNRPFSFYPCNKGVRKMREKESAEQLLAILKERAKELNCMYQVEEVLGNRRLSLAEIFEEIIRIIPSGWQYPEICRARIVFENKSFQSPDYQATPWTDRCEIRVDEKTVGSLEVTYLKKVPPQEDGFFLEKERKLIRTIADRIGQTILHRQMEQILREWENAGTALTGEKEAGREWQVIIDLLHRTDPDLLAYLCRKMINYLAKSGVAEAAEIIRAHAPTGFPDDRGQAGGSSEENYPLVKQPLESIARMSERTFQVAAANLSDQEITLCLQRWITEQKAYFLIKAVDRPETPLAEIIEAVTRYRNMAGGRENLYSPTERWLKVSLFSRFFTDQLDVVKVAKQYIEVGDFSEIVKRIIYPPGSHGRLGGKSTGLFLASQILRKAAEHIPGFIPPAVPKTWYICTDASTDFLHYNNLEDLNEQKYKDLFEIRIEYPHIIQLMKNSRFPPWFVQSLSMALDDFGERPLIVRSSSLLEDRMGAAFSGKYKSLFLANQGPKQKRLEALMDAIAEIYASLFSPDSIQYRREHGLLDFHEEMGIMIQEVVGTRIGRYFLPFFAGVAFSNNEFRWSPRLKREDGLVRLTPGLGTRAVDRLSDDFPVLIAPGQPGLRVNTTPEEILRYSPKKVDLINLEKEVFETVPVKDLVAEYGRARAREEIPNLHQIISIHREGEIIHPGPYGLELENGLPVVTFHGLVTRTPFTRQIRTILEVLREKMGFPVDIEFASDGENFYLLQCRSQYGAAEHRPVPIPRDIPAKEIIFTARRHITNGAVPAVSYIVYVDPEGYAALESMEQMVEVGKAVGALNSLLPKRQFILMGPGRWGSRGDIRLGVPVTYADLNNTAVLIEIARKKGNYVPELSFGTHFFQDLVESGILYLPLYPDEEGNIFNERFFTRTENKLAEVLPEYGRLAGVIRLLDVTGATRGKVLRLLMNADLEEAVGYLCDPGVLLPEEEKKEEVPVDDRLEEDFWRWRLHMAERLAAKVDPKRFGIKGIYLFGSTNTAGAGPGSDIDLLVHFAGSERQRAEFLSWLEGWSYCLGEVNYLKTGYRLPGLLDVHIVTDEEVKKKTGFAAKIGSLTDPARPLKLGADIG